MDTELALKINKYIHEQCIDGVPHDIGWNVVKLFCAMPDVKKRLQSRQAAVSGSLPLAEKLLDSIVSADPNVIHNYSQSDIVIRGLHSQCKELVKSLGGNDR